MSDYDDDTSSDADLERMIQQVKPGFAVVRSSTAAPSAPLKRVATLSTPDLTTLRRKGRALGVRPEPSEEQAPMDDRTASLMKKFLKSDPRKIQVDAPRATSAEPRQRGRIVSVRPDNQQDADASEAAPKDVQVVFDKKGPLGESS
jgi:hypothetical protein